MTDTTRNAPERMFIADVRPEGAPWHKAFNEKPATHSKHYHEYVRADIVTARAEAAEARVRELEGLLREIMNAEGECELMDAIDNTGRPCQSHSLDTALTRARAVLTGEKQ